MSRNRRVIYKRIRFSQIRGLKVQLPGTVDAEDITTILMWADAVQYAKDTGLSLAETNKRFTTWATDPEHPCPYSSMRYHYLTPRPERLFQFAENRELWKPLPFHLANQLTPGRIVAVIKKRLAAFSASLPVVVSR